MNDEVNELRSMELHTAPRGFDHLRRKHYISYSSEEEKGVAEGSPLAQSLIDMLEPDPKTQPLVRKTNEHGGLLSSTPLEEEGDRSSWKSVADKLNYAFLEDGIASDSEDESGPSCFCSMPVQIIDEDAEDDSYVDLRRESGHRTNRVSATS
ncbi:actin-like protein 7A-like [Platysternon megacephalum]|uniref:Actin-like protein 7A-like n=1 Tax=Platysternon megacephalum TaxID=55544 RepID=A0A4D9DLD0_9SAUR|nr:actin-like protein 7A-like [Platysternon megacephalum]